MYLLQNNTTITSLQKGKIDGVIEHILSLNSIIHNSNLPFFMTFIDLHVRNDLVPSIISDVIQYRSC